MEKISADFAAQLTRYKYLIDEDIAAYAGQLRAETLRDYGVHAHREIDAYLSILERGGKRIRGSLVMNAYAMCGGADQEAALTLARIVEMMHAYILIIDDFQDKSSVRRSGPTAHTLLAEYHAANELGGDSVHFGASIALNSALSGNHLAQAQLAQLNVPAEIKVRLMDALNTTMVITAHGQTNDIQNEVIADVTTSDVERVLEWKTAHYTFFNPLTLGVLLAGGEMQEAELLKPYALHAGKAFQITDDILGIFGSEFESGKSPVDDIREGKRTVLVQHALSHAEASDKNFIVRMLGKADITPGQFERVKSILISSGSLQYAKALAAKHVDDAHAALTDAPSTWSNAGLEFLAGLADALIDRKS